MYACKNPLQCFKIFHYQVEKRLSGGRAVRTPFSSMNPVFVRLPLAAKVTTLSQKWPLTSPAPQFCCD